MAAKFWPVVGGYEWSRLVVDSRRLSHDLVMLKMNLVKFSENSTQKSASKTRWKVKVKIYIIFLKK